MNKQSWYETADAADIDSPALLIYRDRVARNISSMISLAGSAGRLVPHVKTHKMREIVEMQLKAGIHRFKCATIAEAEMLAGAGVNEILIAYQLAGPKVIRFFDLVDRFPNTDFASLVDNLDSARALINAAAGRHRTARVYIDVNSGMHRTGIAPGETLTTLHQQLCRMEHLTVLGWHIYDGHIHDTSYEERKKRIEDEFKQVQQYMDQSAAAGFPVPEIIAGGTPAFTTHALRPEVYCSPGTVILWDARSEETLGEQPFEYAALLLTRVISKPAPGLVTLDLGHKAVAAENEISDRVTFLNLEHYTARSQSEEHLVLEVEGWDEIQVGDILYGVPYHVCPTVALYDTVQVIEDGHRVDEWQVIARKRKISV